MLWDMHIHIQLNFMLFHYVCLFGQTLGHSGFNVGGELGGFLSVAENTGLRLLTKDSKEWNDAIGSVRSMDDLLSNMVTKEERSVIDANGGVRVTILGKKKYGRKG